MGNQVDLYIKGFEEASSLNEKPIFLDANVLLYFYKVSNVAKDNFIKYINKNIDRIHITEHVKNEFLKSRVRVINNDYLDVLNNVPNQLQKNINHISNFINTNKTVLNDYSDIYTELKETENILTKTLDKLKYEINKDLEKNKNIKYNDPLLETYSKIKVINNLSQEELQFLANKFSYLENNFRGTYPGKVDQKNKNSNSNGDFIIFHEIMKFMKKKETSVVFLTNDLKEDWFDIDEKNHRHPQISYIESTFNNTGYFNYILDANRNLSDILNIKIQLNTYQKKHEKERRILKEKSFTHDWVDEQFKDILNSMHTNDFTIPVSEIELDFGVYISDIDFEDLLEYNESTAHFQGDGRAYHSSTDVNNNEVSIHIPFSFEGTCTINTEYKSINIDDLEINESSADLDFEEDKEQIKKIMKLPNEY